MNTQVTELVLGTPDLDTTALSGAGLLSLVTTGMYDSPLSMYREYIQNAADAVSRSGYADAPRVEIAIDVNARSVRIRDNGPGLAPREAIVRLLPIGRSAKTLGLDRGFRGVGRLAGLAFANTVTFRTRAREDQEVTRVTWHSDRLPELTSTDSELEQAIIDCVDVESLSGVDYPDHFFEVEVNEVARHSAGLLLNRNAVREYIGEVCPVPMSAEFRFAEEIQGLFDGVDLPLTLDVQLEGDSGPIERPYGETIQLSASKEAEFTVFQTVHIPSLDAECDAAIGWIAHSPYLGAIPKSLRVRGIRARVGNIQIGDEAVFDNLFAEERFNRWCVGELHILDPRIIPNARRDYFESGPHLRNLENQLIPVMRDISSKCRRESTGRNRARRALSTLCNVEDLYSLATSGFLTAENSAGLVQEALLQAEEAREVIARDNIENGALEKLDLAEEKLRHFTVGVGAKPFGDMDPAEVDVYRRVFGVLVTRAPSPSSAKEWIESVFEEATGMAQDDTTSGVRVEVSPLQARLSLENEEPLTPS